MRAKARNALFAVLATCAIGGAFPAVADAYEAYYYCSFKPVGLWCDGQANGSYPGLHSWDYHYGWYPGTWDNTVTVCQRVFRPSTGYVLPGSSCGLNATAADYGTQTCICLEANVRQYSLGPHTIWGYADADF
jgi:hypothetical protein